MWLEILTLKEAAKIPKTPIEPPQPKVCMYMCMCMRSMYVYGYVCSLSLSIGIWAQNGDMEYVRMRS